MSTKKTIRIKTSDAHGGAPYSTFEQSVEALLHIVAHYVATEPEAEIILDVIGDEFDFYDNKGVIHADALAKLGGDFFAAVLQAFPHLKLIYEFGNHDDVVLWDETMKAVQEKFPDRFTIVKNEHAIGADMSWHGDTAIVPRGALFRVGIELEGNQYERGPLKQIQDGRPVELSTYGQEPNPDWKTILKRAIRNVSKQAIDALPGPLPDKIDNFIQGARITAKDWVTPLLSYFIFPVDKSVDDVVTMLLKEKPEIFEKYDDVYITVGHIHSFKSVRDHVVKFMLPDRYGNIREVRAHVDVTGCAVPFCPNLAAVHFIEGDKVTDVVHYQLPNNRIVNLFPPVRGNELPYCSKSDQIIKELAAPIHEALARH